MGEQGEGWRGRARGGREREAEQGEGGRAREEGDLTAPLLSHHHSSSYPVHCPDLAESVHHPC